MGKKNNIIEINGQRYDAHTGAALDHAVHTELKPKPAAKPTSVTKSITVHQVHHASRQPARKLSRHAPQRSTTLMRRAVKKPPANLKHRIKAQSHVDALTEQPAVPVMPKLSFGQPDPKRLQHASHVKKSQLITHFNFSPGQSAYTITVTAAKPIAKPAHQTKSPVVPKRQPAPDASDIFERAIQQATSHLEPAPKTHKKRRLHLVRRHAKA